MLGLFIVLEREDCFRSELIVIGSFVEVPKSYNITLDTLEPLVEASGLFGED